MIELYIAHIQDLHTFQNTKYHIKKKIFTFAKICEQVFNNKNENRKFSFIVEKSNNNGSHNDVYT